MSARCITLIPDGEDRWIEHSGIDHYRDYSPAKLLELIADERKRISFALDGWASHASRWFLLERDDMEGHDKALLFILREMPSAPKELTEEVADKVGISLEEYWVALDRVKPVTHVSIDLQPEGDDNRPLLDKLMDPNHQDVDTQMIIAEIRHHLKAAIGELPERQRQCVLMYYGKEMSLAEIAAVFKVTPSRICQILSSARSDLRRSLDGTVAPDDFRRGDDR